jgi:Ala-tRNA(Pro) deacylase
MFDTYPLTPETLLGHLKNLGVEAETLWHEAVFRVEEGHDIKAAMPGLHSKNLFLKDDKGRLILISAAQDTVLNLKALPKVIGSGRLSFGSEERLYDALGVRPGSVTALALINDPEHKVRFIYDKALNDADRVNFHPLTNTATTNLKQADFKAFMTSLNRSLEVIDFTDPRLI